MEGAIKTIFEKVMAEGDKFKEYESWKRFFPHEYDEAVSLARKAKIANREND